MAFIKIGTIRGKRLARTDGKIVQETRFELAFTGKNTGILLKKRI